jgi:hypothetical protein
MNPLPRKDAQPVMSKGQWAVMVSLAAHLGMLALSWWWPGPAPVRYAAVDTRTGVGDGEFAVYFAEPRAAVPLPPAEAAPEPAAPAPVPAPVNLAPVADMAAAPNAPGGTGSHGASGTGSASQPSGGPGGSGGSATFFEIPVAGRSVVYVLDRSASMGLHGRWAAARRELLASLARLPEEAWFQIVAFNSRAEPLRLDGLVGLVPATAANKARAAAFVEQLPAEGGTAHLPAFRQALALEPEVVFFLTDADDLRDEEVRLVTQLNRGRSVIHTIELTTAHRGRRDMPLQVLARTNRGSYQAVAH